MTGAGTGSLLTAVAIVFALGLVTALATGLGALPFALIRTVRERTIARANAIAAGLMLGASFGLLLEGTRYGTLQTLIGGGVGVASILLGEKILGEHEIPFGKLGRADARQVLLLLGVMTLHSFSEGVAVGVSFGGGEKLGGLITLAIAVHNIPEGLAISAVMRPKGASVASCAWWSVFSSLPQPLMAVPAFLFVESMSAFLPYGLGFAAGAMVFMVYMELLPEAYAKERPPAIGLLVSITFAGMMLFQVLL